MFKRYFWLTITIVFFTFQFFVGTASALVLDAATRTVPLNERGETIVLSREQVNAGYRQFQYACAQCHAGGITKTNQNVGLEPEALALAVPARNTIEGLVDYMKNPTTYDGEIEISEYHPSTKSVDIFPEMRNLTDDDLTAIAGHILLQPKVLGAKWGSGKISY